MKSRFFMAACLLIIPFAALAQDNGRKKIPDGGNWMIELGMNPFEKDFVLDGLKVKYWASDRFVLRLGFEYDREVNKREPKDWGSEKITSLSKEKRSQFGIKPGFEIRILKNSKASPYVGIEFAYRNQSASASYMTYNYRSYDDNLYSTTKSEVDGAWLKTESFYSYPYYHTITSYSNGAFKSFGANLLLGSDFYLVRNFYFGFEIGFGYDMKKYKMISSESTTTYVAGYEPEITSNVYPKGRSSQWRFYTDAVIRLGVWF